MVHRNFLLPPGCLARSHECLSCGFFLEIGVSCFSQQSCTTPHQNKFLWKLKAMTLNLGSFHHRFSFLRYFLMEEMHSRSYWRGWGVFTQIELQNRSMVAVSISYTIQKMRINIHICYIKCISREIFTAIWTLKKQLQGSLLANEYNESCFVFPASIQPPPLKPFPKTDFPRILGSWKKCIWMNMAQFFFGFACFVF